MERTNTDILARLSTPTREQLLLRARKLNRKRGELLYMAGDRAHMVYILRTGLIRRFLLTTEGRPMAIDVAQAGMFLGEAAVYQTRHSTFAQSLANSALWAIPATDFNRCLASSGELALWVAENLNRRALAVEELTEMLKRQAAPARMAALLLNLTEPPVQPSVEGLSHQDLGDLIGVYRETATHILNTFKKIGLIALRPMYVEVLRPQALAQLANESRRRSVLNQFAPAA